MEFEHLSFITLLYSTLRTVIADCTLSRVNGVVVAFSGERVRSYMSLVWLCNDLVSMHQYISLPNKGNRQFTSPQLSNSNCRYNIMQKLHPLWQGLMANARMFQKCVVQQWNPFYHMLSPFLALCTSTHNECIKADMGKILLGLVTAEDEQGPFTDRPHSQNKWVLLIGDGLSLQNFWNFLRTLNSFKFSFTNYYQQS